MNKYYVLSGELQKVIYKANSPLDAAEKAIICAEGEMLDYFLYVSEIGFRGPVGLIGIIDTDSLPEWCFDLDEIIQY